MIKLSGFSKTIKKIKEISKKQAEYGSTAAMHEIVLKTKSESMIRTPVDTGHLRSSHFVKVWKSSGAVINGLVYNTAEYAPYVHEILTNRHPRGGEAKFLEKALFAVAPTATRIIRRRLRHAAGGNFFTSSDYNYTRADWKLSVRR